MSKVKLNKRITTVPESITITFTLHQAVAFYNLFGRMPKHKAEILVGNVSYKELYEVWKELYALLTEDLNQTGSEKFFDHSRLD